MTLYLLSASNPHLEWPLSSITVVVLPSLTYSTSPNGKLPTNKQFSWSLFLLSMLPTFCCCCRAQPWIYMMAGIETYMVTYKASTLIPVLPFGQKDCFLKLPCWLMDFCIKLTSIWVKVTHWCTCVHMCVCLPIDICILMIKQQDWLQRYNLILLINMHMVDRSKTNMGMCSLCTWSQC